MPDKETITQGFIIREEPIKQKKRGRPEKLIPPIKADMDDVVRALLQPNYDKVRKIKEKKE